MKVGLARVSSVGQNLDSQLIALKEYGCEKIFQEKKSGTKAEDREVLREWIDFMRENDEAVVTRIDRCSRSVLDLQLIVKELEEKEVTFAATEQSINTKTPEGKCFLNMLSVFSEFETNLRKERQMDGKAIQILGVQDPYRYLPRTVPLPKSAFAGTDRTHPIHRQIGSGSGRGRSLHGTGR